MARAGFDPNHPASKNILQSMVPSGGEGLSLLSLASGGGNLPAAGIDAILGPVLSVGSFQTGTLPCPAITVTKFTAGWIGSLAALNTNWLLELLDGGNGLTLQQTSGGVLSINSTTTTVSTFATTLTVGVPYFFGVSTISGGTSYLVILNLKTGAVITEAVSAAAFSSVLNGTYRFCDTHTNNGQLVAASCASNQYLSLQQLQQWAQNPWEFWYPRVTQTQVAQQSTTTTAAPTTVALAAFGALKLFGSGIASFASALVAPPALGIARATKFVAGRGPFIPRNWITQGSLVSAAFVALSGLVGSAMRVATGITGKTSLFGSVNTQAKAKDGLTAGQPMVGQFRAGVFAKAGPTAAAPLRATANVGVASKASAIGKAALSAASSIAAFLKSPALSTGAVVALLAKAFLSVTSSALGSGKTTLSAAARAAVEARASSTNSTQLSGSTKAQSALKAASTFPAILKGIFLARVSAAAQATGAASLAGRSSAVSQLRIAIGAGVIQLLGSAAVAFKAVFTPPTGKTSLSARSAVNFFGRLSQPGALQLLAGIFIKTFGRFAPPTGTTPLQGKMVMTLRSTSSTTFTQRMLASAKVSVAAIVNMVGRANLSGSGQLQAAGRAGLARLALLASIAKIAARAAFSPPTGKAGLSGFTKAVAALGATITAVAPLTGIQARTSIKVAIAGLLYAFGISSRVLATPADLRVAGAPADARSVSAPAETRTVIAPPKN